MTQGFSIKERLNRTDQKNRDKVPSIYMAKEFNSKYLVFNYLTNQKVGWLGERSFRRWKNTAEKQGAIIFIDSVSGDTHQKGNIRNQ